MLKDQLKDGLNVNQRWNGGRVHAGRDRVFFLSGEEHL